MFISKNKNANISVLDSDLFKDIFSQNSKLIGHLSGFTCFDYPTAYCDTSDVDGMLNANGGFFPRIYEVIGESETGKTSLLVQLGGSIVNNYCGSNMIFIDSEGNCGPERIKSLNNWNDYEYSNKCVYIPPSPPITVNRVYDIIRRVAHSKSNKKGKIELITPYINPYTGKFIEIYPPTIVILDSIPSLVISQSLEESVDGDKDFKSIDQIASNVDGMREAKENTNFLRKVKGLLDEYNIILFMVNHIAKEVSMGMFDKPKKFHPHLKPGEKLKGGNEQIFQAFGLFRISQKEMIDERNPIYGDSIFGYVNSIDIIKNKGNVSGISFPYVFDKRTGYRHELSDFELLFQRKFGISGSPLSMYMTILPEIKFTRKTLVNKCEEYPLLARAINFTAKYCLGNEMVVHNRFGELDLIKFSQMPIEWRTSILFSSTRPYPGYTDNLDEFLQLQYQALNGSIFTGYGQDYIDPINVDKLKRITSLSEKGYCDCGFVKNNDPIEMMMQKEKK